MMMTPCVGIQQATKIVPEEEKSETDDKTDHIGSDHLVNAQCISDNRTEQTFFSNMDGKRKISGGDDDDLEKKKFRWWFQDMAPCDDCGTVLENDYHLKDHKRLNCPMKKKTTRQVELVKERKLFAPIIAEAISGDLRDKMAKVTRKHIKKGMSKTNAKKRAIKENMDRLTDAVVEEYVTFMTHLFELEKSSLHDILTQKTKRRLQKYGFPTEEAVRQTISKNGSIFKSMIKYDMDHLETSDEDDDDSDDDDHDDDDGNDDSDDDDDDDDTDQEEKKRFIKKLAN